MTTMMMMINNKDVATTCVAAAAAAANGCAAAFVAASRALAIAVSTARWATSSTSTTTTSNSCCGMTEAVVTAGIARSVLGRQAMAAVINYCCCNCIDHLETVDGATTELAEPLRTWVDAAAASCAASIGAPLDVATVAARWCVMVHVLNRTWCTHRVQCTACSLAFPEQLLDVVANVALGDVDVDVGSTGSTTMATTTTTMLNNDTLEAISWHDVLQQISQIKQQQQQQQQQQQSPLTRPHSSTSASGRVCSSGDPPVLVRSVSTAAASGMSDCSGEGEEEFSESLFSRSGFGIVGEDNEEEEEEDSESSAEAASTAARTASSLEDDSSGDSETTTRTRCSFASPSPIRRRTQPQTWSVPPSPVLQPQRTPGMALATQVAAEMQQQQQFATPTRDWVQAVVDQALAQAQSTIIAEIRAKQGEFVGALAQAGEIDEQQQQGMAALWDLCPWMPKDGQYRAKPCSYFFHTGHCSKGDACNFSHELLPGMTPPPPPPALKRAPGMSPTGYVPVEMLLKTKPCKFFFARGWCLKGEHCNFSHDLH